MLNLAISLLLTSTLATAPTRPAPAIAPTLASAAEPDDTQATIHQPRAERWLARNGFAPDAPPKLDALLSKGFTHLSLGIYDLMVLPSALADKKRLPDVKQAAIALIDAQLEWIEWLPATDGVRPAPGSLATDGKTLKKWITKWKTKPFDDLATTRGADLLALTAASEKTRQAAQNFAEYMLGGGPIAALEKARKPVGLILIPRREDFVEFISTVGFVEMRHRNFFWIDGTSVWTQFNFDGNRAVALEFATPRADTDYTLSMGMNDKNPDTLAEQVAQLGSRSLIEASLGDGLDSLLVSGLANNIVISVFGEVDTRTDGDTSSRSTEAVDVFVANGNPSGGSVANTADSRWREKRGAEHFTSILNRSQKNAGKQAEEKWAKLAGFQLVDATVSNHHVVQAPFFGAGASSNPPAAFTGDHMEFLRAYRVAFLHWLRTEAAGKKRSAETFARMLRSLAAGSSLTEALEQAYGVPLSAGTTEELMRGAGEASLERSFLTWISKQ